MLTPSTRTILELVAYHGDLSFPDLRTLTLIHPDLTVPKHELEKRRFRDHLGNSCYAVGPRHPTLTLQRMVYHGTYKRVYDHERTICVECSCRKDFHKPQIDGSHAIITKTCRYIDGLLEGPMLFICSDVDTDYHHIDHGYNYKNGMKDGEAVSWARSNRIWYRYTKTFYTKCVRDERECVWTNEGDIHMYGSKVEIGPNLASFKDPPPFLSCSCMNYCTCGKN